MPVRRSSSGGAEPTPLDSDAHCQMPSRVRNHSTGRVAARAAFGLTEPTPDFLVVARHEAAHAVALDALGGHFRTITLTSAPSASGRTYMGQLRAPGGSVEALLVSAVAGAVADTGVPLCEDWRAVLEHQRTVPCCAADYIMARDLSAELNEGSVAEKAIKTAIHALVEHEVLWKATTFALLQSEWDYPTDQIRTKTLHWHTETGRDIAKCPPGWSDFCSIKENLAAVAA